MTTVYIVDDHKDTCDVLSMTLAIHGYQAKAFHSFESALQDIRARGSAATIVFMDLNIPDGMRAAEFVSKVRQLHPASRIIAISGAPSIGIIAGEIGANGFLLKPFSMGEVMESLQTAS